MDLGIVTWVSEFRVGEFSGTADFD